MSLYIAVFLILGFSPGFVFGVMKADSEAYSSFMLTMPNPPDADSHLPMGDYDATNTSSITIGAGDQTALVPLNFTRNSSIYQCLYFAPEIGMLGYIHEISLYNQFFSSGIVDKPTKIWMGLTDRQSLQAGWISSNEMTLVFDGTMNFPSGNNSISFPLQAPFVYLGGNLVVMFKRGLDTQVYSSYDRFISQDGSYGRARNMTSNIIDYVPTELWGGSVTSSFPQTTLIMSPLSEDPVFSLNPTAYDFGNTSIGGSRSRNFTITNVGGGNLAINAISLAGSPTYTISSQASLPINLALGASSSFTISYAPSSQGEDIATLTISNNLGRAHDLREEESTEISGTGVPDVHIGIGNEIARIPIDFYNHRSLFETIYTAEELNNIVGTITGLKLYNNFPAHLPDTPIQIWLGTTSRTNLSSGWIPSTALTLVYDSTVDFPPGENTISITFPEPYLYVNGQNLLMLVHRPMWVPWYSSEAYFKAQTGGNNRSRKTQSDTIELNPAAPSGGSVSGLFPKTTFTVNACGIGQLTGRVLDASGNPLAGAEISLDSPLYYAISDAQGDFGITSILADSYTINISHHGYVNQSMNILIERDQSAVMEISMELLPQVRVSGTILSRNTGSGIARAQIELLGFEDYSASSTDNGSFAIPAVFAANNYAYTINATGYSAISGIIEVSTVDCNMGYITLTELAHVPHSVVATLNNASNAVNLIWAAPDIVSLDILTTAENIDHGDHTAMRKPDRALLGYHVWRFSATEEHHTESWVRVSEAIIPSLSYTDPGWGTLAYGTYRWAVKAIYSTNLMSAPAFSNVLVKAKRYGSIAGFVRGTGEQGIGNAIVTAEGGLNSTTNSVGAYSLILATGSYTATASAAEYHDLTYSNIRVREDQISALNFSMIPTSLAAETLPVLHTALKGNYPNPFNPETTIHYELKDAGYVRLDLFSLKGSLVRSLVHQDQAAGRYRVVFDGCDDMRVPLPSGIYIYRFSSARYRSTRKMILMQ